MSQLHPCRSRLLHPERLHRVCGLARTGTPRGGEVAILTGPPSAGARCGTWTRAHHYINYSGSSRHRSNRGPMQPESMGSLGGQGRIPSSTPCWTTKILEHVHQPLGRPWQYGVHVPVHAVLDSMVAVISLKLPRQFDRWGSNMGGWETELQQLHDFIDSRAKMKLWEDGGLLRRGSCEFDPRHRRTVWWN